MKIHEKVACLHTQTCHQTRAPFLEVSAKPRILRSCHQDYKNRKKKKKDMISPKYLALPLASTA